jgi:hypothetical protein
MRGAADGLVTFADRFDIEIEGSREDPIFLLASIWRSGSTLAQRMIVSSGEIALWGEPYDLAAPVQRITEILSPISRAWPPDHYVRGADRLVSDEWVANLYPDPKHMMAAMRSFMIELFAVPARAAGYQKWGVKEVRLDGHHATVLKALFPAARLVYLVRNPYDAWLSYRDLHEQRPRARWWYHRWPDILVDTPARFGVLWRQATDSFIATADALGALLISYEGLAMGGATGRIQDYLDIEIADDVLDKRVGGSHQRHHTIGLSIDEIRELRTAVDPTAFKLGYGGPS